MTSRFTQEERTSLQQWLELPIASHGIFRSEKKRVALSAVREALHLPPIPYRQFLGPDCWLAGGALMTWLFGTKTETQAPGGDFDFFFPSPHALDATARAMLAQGFQLRGYRTYSRTIREYLQAAIIEDRKSGIWDEFGKLAPITEELIERLQLTYLEFRSPGGDVVQLVAFFKPTPHETIMKFDLSICQLVANDEYLYFGPWTWSDLMRNRCRLVYVTWPDATFRRLFKYARREFWPYPTSLLRAFYLLFALVVRKGPKHLFLSLRNTSPGKNVNGVFQ